MKRREDAKIKKMREIKKAAKVQTNSQNKNKTKCIVFILLSLSSQPVLAFLRWFSSSRRPKT